MFGSHFYDEIYEDQRHIRLIARICQLAETEKDILSLPTAVLTDNDALNNSPKPIGISDYGVQRLTSELQRDHKVKGIRLLEDLEECLLAEIGAIPHVSHPASVRVIRSYSQTLLHQNISSEDLRECCVVPNVRQIQCELRFRNRHYCISKDGILVLVPDRV